MVRKVSDSLCSTFSPLRATDWSHIICWLVVWNMTFIFPFSWECHHPNWRAPFFRGVAIPPTSTMLRANSLIPASSCGDFFFSCPGDLNINLRCWGSTRGPKEMCWFVQRNSLRVSHWIMVKTFRFFGEMQFWMNDVVPSRRFFRQMMGIGLGESSPNGRTLQLFSQWI